MVASKTLVGPNRVVSEPGLVACGSVGLARLALTASIVALGILHVDHLATIRVTSILHAVVMHLLIVVVGVVLVTKVDILRAAVGAHTMSRL